MFPQTSLLASALLLSTASAFQQTSPFFLLSSTPFHQDSSLRSTQLSSAAHVLENTLAALSNCDAEFYLFVKQSGVSAEDFDGGNGMPNMRRRMMEGAGMYEAAAQIPEVVGGVVDFEGLVQGVQDSCGGRRVGLEENYENAHDSDKPIITTLDFAALPSEAHARQGNLRSTDGIIENILTEKASHKKHVLIFVSSPPSPASSQDHATTFEESQTYEMDAPILHDVLHSDLKRDMGVWPRASNSSDDEEHQKGLPLFERYSFLSPAIFMGLTVTILLISILYVGLSAIAGLEVSYLAFSKEMGPAAQQKNSQKLQ